MHVLIILICVFFFISEEVHLNFQFLEHSLISPLDDIVHYIVSCEPDLFFTVVFLGAMNSKFLNALGEESKSMKLMVTENFRIRCIFCQVYE